MRMAARWPLFALAATLLALYLGWAAAQGLYGFPLDDAWIHQTYARNLAHSGRWFYFPGDAGRAGSTAPLWTLLLALGYALRLPHLAWSWALGGVCLLWLALAGMRLWRQAWFAPIRGDLWVGAALLASWPLLWAAVSGMETLLFTALALTALATYAAWAVRPERAARYTLALLGGLCGLLALARPEGLLALLLVGVGVALRPTARARRLAVLGLAATIPLAPYFVFNWLTGGAPWPTTFYAKPAEYAAALAEPFAARLARLLFFSLGGPPEGWRGISGAHLALLPGLIAAGAQAARADWRARRLLYLLPLAWALGHVALYAWRLPVTYQHGRYLMPVLPVWTVYGLAGWRVLLARLPDAARMSWALRRAAAGTFGVLLAFFLLLGARAYAADVALIEGEMVTAARWVAANTPPEARIAAHDVGALGYFAPRPLLDLAGLLAPEITPWLNDPAALAAMIRTGGADYLVTAPGWPYAEVAQGAEPLFTTGYAPTRARGLNNVTVYRLRP